MIFAEHAAILAIAIPLFAAFVLPLVNRLGSRARNFVAIAALAVMELFVIVLALDVFAGNIHVYTLGATLPSLVSTVGFPVRILLEVDAMSAFMALASATVALLAGIYSLKLVEKHKGNEKYFSLLLLMAGAMIGMVFTGDLFSLFVFLELLSIASAALIAFYMMRGESFEAGFKYLVISSLAALMVLLAAGLLYGQYNFLNIAALASVMQFGFIDKVAFVLLVAAFAMKCGAVPLHMWVSDSYGEAPAAVSAILVVASQASLYALFRVCFTLFAGMPVLEIIAWAIIALALLSMFVGVTMALMQKDIKRMMAYHAVSQTGYMLLGVGVGLAVLGNAEALALYGVKAIEGSLFHVINHALYKGLLFLTAGAIIYRVGTKDLNKMGGLAHKMPLTTVFFIIGALAIAGLPPFNGFASKLLIYESVFLFSPILSVIAMVVSILTLASFVKVFHSAFMGPERAELGKIGEVPAKMWVPMAVLALLIILVGLFPGIVVENLVRPAVQALLNQSAYIGAVI